MVLPLIPVAVIAVGALTGGSGLALGGKGALDLKRANDRIKGSHLYYRLRREASEQAVAETNDLLEKWRLEQETALTTTVVRFVDFLRRHARQVKDNERLLVDGLEAGAERVIDPGGVNVDSLTWIGGVVTSAALSGGANVAAVTVATAVGSASTGAAISGLSGAAAQSATMAWLGGGALSAGGGGVALGGLVLNFVTIGPALLLGGLVTSGQGRKALTQAAAKQAEVDVAVAELDATAIVLDAVENRVDELRSILQSLVGQATEALELLESEPFLPVEHAPRFQQAHLFVKAVSEVATATILDSDGELSDESTAVTVKYRTMTKEKNNG